MKSQNILFVLTALIVAIPTLTICKSKETSAIEIVKPRTNISEYISPIVHPFLYARACGQGKRVLYVYPWSDHYNTHVLSPEDAALYKKNNIAVSKQDCSLVTIDQLKELKPSFFKFMRCCWGGARVKTYAWKAFSLISDANKKIEIYGSRFYGNDMTFYLTSHVDRIALLIDEKGAIVSILDNVKSEKDIFKAFGIK